ncbi:hypothetical protein QG37_06690 [Candidozyma auris]|uniref:Uncharacterized protein n=1 Tax=Candidozyma auris TaxID=498019 RepID=A0A0L0NTK4_CANAR|nr:hypothetical protein QG37_06690 [[Candida] auris]
MELKAGVASAFQGVVAIIAPDKRHMMRMQWRQ